MGRQGQGASHIEIIRDGYTDKLREFCVEWGKGGDGDQAGPAFSIILKIPSMVRDSQSPLPLKVGFPWLLRWAATAEAERFCLFLRAMISFKQLAV